MSTANYPRRQAYMLEFFVGIHRADGKCGADPRGLSWVEHEGTRLTQSLPGEGLATRAQFEARIAEYVAKYGAAPMIVRFRYDYPVLVRQVCCFSGTISYRRGTVHGGQHFILERRVPSPRVLQCGGRRREPSPQHSDLYLTGVDIRMCDVPNDVFEEVK